MKTHQIVITLIISSFILFASGCSKGGDSGVDSGGDDNVDILAPFVVSVEPADNVIDIPVDTVINITFNEEIDQSSLSTSTLALSDSNGSTITATVNAVGNIVTFIPSTPLDYETTYHATLSSAVADLFGNLKESDYSWSFTTIVVPDIIAPSVQSHEPSAGEVDVLRNSILEIIFDEPLDCSGVDDSTILLNPFASGEITCDGIAINLAPSKPLIPDTAYSVTINAGIRDLAGNPTLTDTSWSYTTGPAIAWARTYRSGYSILGNAIEASDDTYVMAGTGSGFNTAYTYWIMKTDIEGDREWEHYLDQFHNGAISITQAADGGFVVAGRAYTSGDPSLNALIMKHDKDGAPVWQKVYSSSASVPHMYSIIPVSAGGYVVVGDFSVAHHRAWVLRIDDTGNVLWDKRYSSGIIYKDSFAYSIKETADGGYVFAGDIAESTGSSSDLWVVKLDSSGDISWQRNYGKLNLEDKATSIEQTADGGYIVAGYTESFGLGLFDLWVLKLSPTGVAEWQYTYGGTGDDRAASIRSTIDGGYVVAGQTSSFGAGSDDVWLLKLDINGSPRWQRTYGDAGNNKAISLELTKDGGYIIGGQNRNYITWWVLKIDADGDIQFNRTSGFRMTDTDASAASSTHVPDITTGSTFVGSISVSEGSIPLASGDSTVVEQAP